MDKIVFTPTIEFVGQYRIPRIKINDEQYISFSSADYNKQAPWSWLCVSCVIETNYKGNVMKERASDVVAIANLGKLKKEMKKSIGENFLKDLTKIITELCTNGKFEEASLPKLQQALSKPFEYEVKKKRTVKKKK